MSCPATARGDRIRAQAGGGALLEHSIHSADVLSWLFGPAARVYAHEPPRVRLRRRGHRRAHDRARRVASSATSSRSSTACAAARNAASRCSSSAARSSSPPTSSWAHRRTRLLIQRPDEPAERVDLDALRDEHFDALGLDRRDFVFYTYAADRGWVPRYATVVRRPRASATRCSPTPSSRRRTARRGRSTGRRVEPRGLIRAGNPG